MDNLNIPSHVAIILDGNGRWAKKRNMPRLFGHKKGAEVVEEILKDARDIGIKYLTVYAFSTENWNRSVEEVTGLMSILRKYLESCEKKSMANNVAVKVIGNKEGLAKDIVDTINSLEEKTKNNDGIHFNIAINYGGRDEIKRSLEKIIKLYKENKISLDDLSENLISNNLDTVGMPDPDLLIRTSGEIRTSNFLPWQCAYSEMYFTETLWPDFKKEDLILAIEDYQKRSRRFGGV